VGRDNTFFVVPYSAVIMVYLLNFIYRSHEKRKKRKKEELPPPCGVGLFAILKHTY
jgi:uncharacterized membrane protein